MFVCRRTSSHLADAAPGTDPLRFTLNLQVERTATEALDLGTAASGLGITFEAAMWIWPPACASFDPWTFGVNLDAIVDPSEAFFIEVDRLLCYVATWRRRGWTLVSTPASWRPGCVTAPLPSTATLTIRFTDPNDDGHLTLAELVGTPLTDLVTLTAKGALDVNLPIQARLGGEPVFQPERLPTLLRLTPRTSSVAMRLPSSPRDRTSRSS